MSMNSDTALVLTDPQNDFLSENGVAWELVGRSVYGPQSNDLALQLRKRRINEVILAGMSANLCVEAHLRHLLEQGFEVTVVGDATAAAQHRDGAGYAAALTNAKALERHHGFEFDVAVDDLDGTLHRSFGPRPSSAYIIDPSGTIVFRAQWSNVTPALEEAVAAAAANRRPPTPDVRRTLHSVVQMAGHGPVSFNTAGKGALRDTWRAAPPMAAMIQTSRLFSFLPRHRRGLPALVTMLALALLAVAVVTVVL